MSKKNTYVVIAVALCAILAAGGILASNMGFKLNYPLNKTGTGGSKSGTNTLSLPYFRQTGLNDSIGLIQDIEGGGPPFSKVISVSKFLEATDSLQVYTGRMGSPGAVFPLTAGEGYRVQMSADVNYIIVGSHDPSLSVSLDATGAGSKSGTNDYAPPYNITAATSTDLIKDIEGVAAPPYSKVVSVSKFLTGSDSLQVYTGRMGSPGAVFNLVPGESYRIQMSVTVPYIASHY
jgi:hypothetical protein